MAGNYTEEEVKAIAARGHADPASLTLDEVRAVARYAQNRMQQTAAAIATDPHVLDMVANYQDVREAWQKAADAWKAAGRPMPCYDAAYLAAREALARAI